MEITHRAYARVGFLGNPSDGYYGKTISFLLDNFHASVTLTQSAELCLLPHPLHDRTVFGCLQALLARTRGEGYYGGLRLLMAICSRFATYCSDKGVVLDPQHNFTLRYDTNIPRQAGLSGSSAIICAALHCLLDHYGVASHVPVEDRPGLILAAEGDLSITAGLQDRVIQVYGGLVFMDFARDHMERTGRGMYAHLNPDLLPRLFVIFAANPSESGKIHSKVRERWLAGATGLVQDMAEVASLADAGRLALEARDYPRLAKLMDRNFDLRRRMFGDDALGAANIRLVDVARSVGAAAKFTGSGGAAVAFCPAGRAQEDRLKAACADNGLTIVTARIRGCPYEQASTVATDG